MWNIKELLCYVTKARPSPKIFIMDVIFWANSGQQGPGCVAFEGLCDANSGYHPPADGYLLWSDGGIGIDSCPVKHNLQIKGIRYQRPREILDKLRHLLRLAIDVEPR